MKNVFVKTVVMGCFLVSCYKEKTKTTDEFDTEKEIAAVDILPYDESANTTTGTPFQDSVDILQKKWLRSESNDQLKRLENMSLKSDGEASEYMTVTIVSMFKKKPAPLIMYLHRNRKSVLYNVLTDGLGIDLFVYEKDERILKKQQIKEDALRLSSGKLSKSQIDFTNQLFRDVVPEKFD